MMSNEYRLWTRLPVEQAKDILTAACIGQAVYNRVTIPEDIPSQVLLTLSGIRFLTIFTFSKTCVEDPEFKNIEQALRRRARQAQGILEYPNSGALYLSASEKRSMIYPIDKGEPNISMVWYMDPKTSLSGMYDLILDVFEQELPHAMPRRYGLIEPPQYKFEETGRAHFVDFLTNEAGVVWHGKHPIKYVFVSNASGMPASTNGFRCNRLEILVPSSVYAKENWRIVLHRLFREIAKKVRPFYAEIILGSQQDTRSWWWRGLPRNTGDALIIGTPYIECVPGINQIGKPLNAPEVSGALLPADTLYYLDAGAIQKFRKAASRKLYAPVGKHVDGKAGFRRLIRQVTAKPGAYAKWFPIEYD